MGTNALHGVGRGYFLRSGDFPGMIERQ